MRLYVDTNVVLGLLTSDALTERASALAASRPWTIVISDLAAAEFVSALARKVRTGEVTVVDARTALDLLDRWAERTERVSMTSADVRTADAMLRRFDWPLRTPDAMHIAIAKRLGATLGTFDTRMANAASAMGVAIAQ